MIHERFGLICREDVKIALDLSTNGDILYLGPHVSGWFCDKKLYLVGLPEKVQQIEQFLNGGDE
jgi:hypothetical protein